jgi:MFS family permease
MPIRYLSSEYASDRRQMIAAILLVVNAFVWYFFAVTFFEDLIKKLMLDYQASFLVWGIHFGGITISALIGTSLGKKIGNRALFITIWMTLGIVASLFPLILNSIQFYEVLGLSFFIGVSLGLGMPNCMGYFTNHTNIENRGLLGGLIMLFSGLGLLLLGLTAIKDFTLEALVLAGWRGFGLLTFLLLEPQSLKTEQHVITKEKKGSQSYRSIINQRSFILYFIPWIMFSLVNYLSAPVQFEVLGDNFNFLITVGNGIMAISAVAGGFLADHFGRKRTAIIGFVLLGICYAFLGMYPENLLSWYFYTVINGVAWGFLFVIFVIAIWSDISYSSASDKYYAIGVAPFFISKFLQFVMGDLISQSVDKYALFSFTAFFLFLAVLPLFYAPETLPEKKIRERELKTYLKKAQKIKEKYS